MSKNKENKSNFTNVPTNSGPFVRDENENFRINRVKNKSDIWNNMYADDSSTSRRYDNSLTVSSLEYSNATAVREALINAISNRETLVKLSRELYAINPIYANIINYLSNIFFWRYKVIPHKTYTKSKAKARKEVKEEDFGVLYNLMLEVVDGISIETTFPKLLTELTIAGAVYFTTMISEDNILLDTIVLPDKYCRKVGETQFGTGIISFDVSYFDDVGLQDDKLKTYLIAFPEEIQKAYKKFKSSGDAELRWVVLDPRFSSCILQNEYSIPTLFYLYAGILNYEKYQDNELQRNEDLLKYIVVQTMPIYQDKLVFEMDEVKALHNSMKKIIDKGDTARLLTTYGDVHVERISENDSAQSEVLAKALEAIYDNGGINPTLFTGESVEALKIALVRDQNTIWRYVQQLTNFYTIAINNWFEFKDYEADIEILRISPYTYNEDVEVYKNNATLGVGKLDYIVASGTKQKNIQDVLTLEKYLHLDEIQPMQTSYTQAPEDREDNSGSSSSSDKKESSSSGIEPSGDKKSSSSSDSKSE